MLPCATNWWFDRTILKHITEYLSTSTATELASVDANASKRWMYLYFMRRELLF